MLHKRRLLALLSSLQLLSPIISNTAFALPSNPKSHFPLVLPTSTHHNVSLLQPNSTTPYSAGFTLECFNLTTPQSFPMDVDDCAFAIEAILRDPAGPMALTTFSHSPKHGEYGVPAFWQVDNCVILLTSADEHISDRFRLVDVIIKAQQIIEECPGKSKKSLGGLALVGNGRHFFVVVNGPGGEIFGDAGTNGGGGRFVEKKGEMMGIAERGMFGVLRMDLGR